MKRHESTPPTVPLRSRGCLRLDVRWSSARAGGG